MSDTVADLGRKVKAKHPEYADIPDDVVGRKVKAKFPGEYDDFVDGPGFWDVIGDAAKHGPSRLMDFVTSHPRTEMDKHFAEMTKESGDAFRRGDISTGVGTGLAAFLPGAGDEAMAAGNEYGEGNVGAGFAHTILALAPFAREPLVRGASRVAPVAAGAARGAWEGATAPTTLSLKVKGVPLEFGNRIPASITAGASGAVAGDLIAGKPGAIAGGAVGAGVPIVRGAIRGGRKANAAYKAAQAPPRSPIWQGLPTPPESTPPDFSPIPPGSGALPSGRVPGTRTGEPPNVPPPNPRAPIWQGMPEPTPYTWPDVEPIPAQWTPRPLTQPPAATPRTPVWEGMPQADTSVPEFQPIPPSVAPNARSAAWRAANPDRGLPPKPALTPIPGEAGGEPLKPAFTPEQVEAVVKAKNLEIQQRQAEMETARKEAEAKDKFRRTDLNRAAHAIGTELDLPEHESPAGKKLSMSGITQKLHGKDWSELPTDQMNAVVEFMLTHRRPPTQADIASGLYK